MQFTECSGIEGMFGHVELSSRNKIEAIQIHHLFPGRGEVRDELFLGIGAGIDCRYGGS
jgi:hypothetical protein